MNGLNTPPPMQINYQQPFQQFVNNAVKSFADYEIEKNIRQSIHIDMLQEYDFIIYESNLLISEIYKFHGNFLTRDSRNIYLCYNAKNIINQIDTLEEIETELSTIISRPVEIVIDTKTIVNDKRANPQKIYLPIYLIHSKIEPVIIFDIYDKTKDKGYYFNLFTYTHYLSQRFNLLNINKEELETLHNYSLKGIEFTNKDYYLKLVDEYFINSFLKAFTINNNSKYIEDWITYFFKTLRRIKNNLVLIGNNDVSEEIFFNAIIKQIFGFDYCITISDKILENQSIDYIVQNKLFVHINHIPESLENQKKLKNLLESLIVYERRSNLDNTFNTPFLCQIIFTLEQPHSFLDDFLSHSKIFFIDTIDNINKKMNQPDRISLFNNVAKNLEEFSKQLSSLDFSQIKNHYGQDQYVDLNKQEVLNKRTIHYSDFIALNDTVNFIDKNYDTDNELFKSWLKNPELMKIAISNNSKNPILDPFADNFESILPKEERYKHTYVTGKTGSGKSELLKTLIYRDILRNDCSVILLDIHGDLAHSVTRLVKDKERLVLIDPILEENFSPTLNLFHTEDKEEINIEQISQLISTIINNINVADGGASGTMLDLLENCIPLLVRSNNKDFFDLKRLMRDIPKTKGNKEEKAAIDLQRNYIKESISNFKKSKFEEEYFRYDYMNVENSTRRSVRRRLNKMLKDSIFSNLTNGKNTINLEKQMNSPKNKVIIFNIPKAKMLNTYSHYIKFLIGLIQIIALKRADIKDEKKRPHTHLYIDEFHNFITPTIEEILTESRKYKLFLTFAHQSVSQIKNANLRDIILDNTNVKIIGKNSNKTLDLMNKTLGTKLEDVSKLQAGEFYLQSGINDVIKIKNSNKLLDDKEYISDEQWEEHKKYQLKKYYRSIEEKEVVSDNELRQSDKIDKFIEDILNLDLSESSCLRKIEFVDKKRYEEIQEDFNYEKDNNVQPRIRQQEINIVFQLAFEQNEPIEKIEFFKILKEKDTMFENPKMMGRDKKYRSDNPQEKYYMIPI